MSNPLILKLEHGAELTSEDREVLQRIITSPRHVAAHENIISEGDSPDDVHLVLSGMACRTKTLADGGRSIMALLVPGDFCDLHVAILGEMDHSIVTLTPCIMVDIPRGVILELTERHPRICRALWWATLVDEAILREWLVNMGRRDADARTAHLFCELMVRLASVGLADACGYEMPLTQEELGDVLALSPVHMNRMMQSLRATGLIELKNKRLTITDFERLAAFAGFTPTYLHRTGPTTDKRLITAATIR